MGSSDLLQVDRVKLQMDRVRIQVDRVKLQVELQVGQGPLMLPDHVRTLLQWSPGRAL